MRLPPGFFAALVLLTLSACARKEAAPPPGDGRTPIVVPPEAAVAILTEMRTMLGSVHDIHQALATQDTALAHRAALASGLAAAADPALQPLLPQAFLRLGMATHLQFDSLALAIAAGAPRDSLILRLPRLTANCNTCHQTYRLAPETPAR